MAKLYFNYGVMGSSKTANALMTNFNYESKGQNPIMVKPRIDQRDGERVIHSRIGLDHECVYFDEFRDFEAEEISKFSCIIVDEAQFLTHEDVEYLVHLVDDLDIPVVCYGLKSDSNGNLFTGSEALLVYADKLSEVKTVCWCGRKAIMNARFNSEGIIKNASQIHLGANNSYTCLCRKHWFTGDLGPDLLREI